MRKYYPGITLFKFVGSILVVFAHAHFFDFLDEQKANTGATFSFVSIVVPCFYTISGFLAYKGWSGAKNSYRYIARYLKWIISIYGIFCLIYICAQVVPVFFNNTITLHFIILQAEKVFFRIFVMGPYHTLWFIPPLIFGIITSYYFDKKNKILLAAIIAGIGFILAQFVFGSLRIVTETLIGDHFYNSKYLTITMLQFFITFYFGYGLIFVLAGVIIAKYEHKFMQTPAGAFILLSVAATVCEYLLLNYVVRKNYPFQTYQLVFSMLPNCILLFYGILRVKVDFVRTHHNFINLFSIVVYFSHIFLIAMNIYILKWRIGDVTEFQSVLLVLLTFFEALLLSVIINSLKKNIKVQSEQRVLSKA